MIRAALLFMALAAPAWAEPVTVGDLTIERPRLGAVPPGTPVAGGYLLVINAGEADRLLIVEGATAKTVQIHEMTVEDDVARMRALEDGLPILAGAAVSLEPGRRHLMLLGPVALAPGETHEMTLTFERAGAVRVPFAVEPLGAILDEVGFDAKGGTGGHAMGEGH